MEGGKEEVDMAGIIWWTPERLAWLAARAGEGLSARQIAALGNATWRRKPPLTAHGIQDAAHRAGIRLMARGGRPPVAQVPTPRTTHPRRSAATGCAPGFRPHVAPAAESRRAAVGPAEG